MATTQRKAEGRFRMGETTYEVTKKLIILCQIGNQEINIRDNCGRRGHFMDSGKKYNEGIGDGNTCLAWRGQDG